MKSTSVKVHEQKFREERGEFSMVSATSVQHSQQASPELAGIPKRTQRGGAGSSAELQGVNKAVSSARAFGRRVAVRLHTSQVQRELLSSRGVSGSGVTERFDKISGEFYAAVEKINNMNELYVGIKGLDSIRRIYDPRGKYNGWNAAGYEKLLTDLDEVRLVNNMAYLTMSAAKKSVYLEFMRGKGPENEPYYINQMKSLNENCPSDSAEFDRQVAGLRELTQATFNVNINRFKSDVESFEKLAPPGSVIYKKYKEMVHFIKQKDFVRREVLGQVSSGAIGEQLVGLKSVDAKPIASIKAVDVVETDIQWSELHPGIQEVIRLDGTPGYKDLFLNSSGHSQMRR